MKQAMRRFQERKKKERLEKLERGEILEEK